MSKSLRKAIMTRSKLKNRLNKLNTPENWQSYKIQRNICVKLHKQAKKDYFNNLDVNKLNDNKRFWKTIKPYFSDKGINSHKLILIENDSILTNEMSLAKLMNNYFINITNDLQSWPKIMAKTVKKGVVLHTTSNIKLFSETIWSA